MGINIPSLFDICCYRFAEEGKYCSELLGHERALKRIEEFLGLISGKSPFVSSCVQVFAGKRTGTVHQKIG